MSGITPNLTPVHELKMCTKHPEREATLKCIRCERLMCLDCIVRTPTGYICKECSRSHEDRFFSAANQDYILQSAACFVVMAVIGAILTQVPFASGFLGLFLGPIAGGLAAEAAMRISGRRRGRYTDRIGTAATGLGGFIGRVAFIMVQVQQAMQPSLAEYGAEIQATYAQAQNVALGMIVTSTFLDLWFLAFLLLACFGAYARLRGRI